MDNFDIKITVITPTFNRADFLPQTIESILNQTYKNFEYYILDDGSTDNTKEVVEPYLKDKRVKYLYHENAGEPETVNWGWSLAKGEYFTQINSDDIIDKTLFEEMIRVLDNNDNYLVAYSDYKIIDEKNNVIESIKSPDWNFLEALSNFSCYAAMVGTFIKRSKFKDWNHIRTKKYLYINDIEMYWNMALVGDFIHVPKTLVCWRKHKGQISVNRVDSVYEIVKWYNEYFYNKSLPEKVFNVKEIVSNNILDYTKSLLSSVYLTINKKCEIEQYIKKGLGIINFSCLQIGDNDLTGNKFNGHDLHLYLRENKIEANHIVNYKASSDPYTYVYNHNTDNFTETLIKNPLFLNSDIIHLHLIHNTKFDIKYLPIITKLKPTVITLHDAYFLGGHCVHHFNCEKWKNHCYDCEYLDKPFAIESDDTAFQFEIRKKVIQNSNLSVIVASKWMENKVKESPIWKEKKIYRIPFGINQELFKPRNIKEAKNELGISEDSITLMFRGFGYIYKGMDVIKKALKNIYYDKKITLISVDTTEGILDDLKKDYNVIEYKWITDDNFLVKLYQASDLILMPSKQEAFGMMAIEAMSCGKMVLALEGTALKDVINAPECGIVCKEDEYTEQLQYLINNINEVKKRGEKSFQFAKENYNKDIYVNKIIDIYNETIDNYKIDNTYSLILEQLNKYDQNNLSNNHSNNNLVVNNNLINNIKGIYFYKNDKYFILNIFGIRITIKRKK